MKKFRILCLVSAAVALLMSALSCETIYDDIAPCVTEYRVKFKYEYNIKDVDAFHKEVESVDLWLFSTDGRLVWHGSESGEVLRNEDYRMTVPVEPGVYDAVVWGGLKDRPVYVLGADKPESLNDLSVSLKTESDVDGTYPRVKLFYSKRIAQQRAQPRKSGEPSGYECHPMPRP